MSERDDPKRERQERRDRWDASSVMWAGGSGRTYRYWVYEIRHRFKVGTANYILAVIVNGKWIARHVDVPRPPLRRLPACYGPLPPRYGVGLSHTACRRLATTANCARKAGSGPPPSPRTF